MNNEFLPETAVYTPPEFATYGLDLIRAATKYKGMGMGLGIETLDDYFAPVQPGQVAGIIAQTSNYKSGFLHFIAHQMARRLAAQDRHEILIHVSVEEGIEEQALLEFARYSGESAGALARGEVQDWGRLEQASVTVAGIPIYHIGESIARAEDIPNLYMSNMIRSIKALADGTVLHEPPKIAGIFFDYLQAFPIDPEIKRATHEQQRRLQVREDIYRIRQAAKFFACPVFVGIQAKQKLDGARPPIYIPGIYDGEETSAIGQRLDRIITLWLPKMNHSPGSLVESSGFNFRVAEDQLLVKVAKQRGGLPSGKSFACKVDYTRNIITVDRSNGGLGWIAGY